MDRLKHQGPLDPKLFLERLVMSGLDTFTLPQELAQRLAVLRELGPGYSEMAGLVTIGVEKRIELRRRLIDPRFLQGEQ